MTTSISATAITSISATTGDSITLRGLKIVGKPGQPTFVIGHGFTNATAKPSTRLVLKAFAAHGTVVAFDFRGHGRSGGLSTVGRDEVMDLDAAVAHARSSGDGPVHVVGFSMGASIALRHAVLGRHRGDSVTAVSSPSRWYIRDTGPMRRVHWLLEHPLGPSVGRLLGIKLGEPWSEIPSTPLESMHQIAPTPLLLVHGTDDHYFSPSHAIALSTASRGHAQLWIEPGMGHAESGSSADLIDRIAAWASASTGAP